MSTVKVIQIQHPSAASAALTLDSSGNLSTSGSLTFPAGSASAPAIQATGDPNTGLFFPAADTIAFAEGGTEVLRIDSSGRILVGTSTSVDFGCSLQVVNSSGLNTEIVRNSADGGGPTHALGKSRGSASSPSIVLSGDVIGTINFRGYDGSNYIETAFIQAAVDGTPGTNDMPGRLVFSTTADGASSPTERMRIDSTGLITIAGSLKDPAITGTILEDVYTISDGAAFEIDPGNGSIQLITLGASRTPKVTNFAAGESVTLMVDDGTAYTLTWTDSTFGGSGVVWKTDAGVAPTLNTSGYTVIVLWKVSTQVYGARVGNA
jgi:hypothetical protein